MRIDAHQHFWKYNPVRDTWITEEMSVLRKDFLPGDLQPILLKNKIDGCVAVQAAQSEEETEFLLGLAYQNPFIKG
ncbi:MAG TPA: amidohydrolase, partial [Cyclobacteriaceae bacterium]